ncbi:MAG: carboxypeptidase-like regulatory domain-containing protein [Ignavibacteriaceae bacterium]
MRLVVNILLLFVFFSILIYSQENNKITVNGRVIDIETRTPLEYVNVFLSNTTIGTSTDKTGQFIIKNVPFGSYNIIFSYVGYEIQSKNLYSYKSDTFNFNISLIPKAINLNQVNVTGNIPEDWKENLEIFKDVFIGETENSKETTILNPEVLNFTRDKKTDVFKAYTDSTVEVENKSLGYKLSIILDSLVYYSNGNINYMFFSKFEEIPPDSKKEELKWKENREKTYLNSSKHFFYALVHNKLDEDYYTLREGPVNGAKIFPEDLSIKSNSDSTIYTFNFMGSLVVKRYISPPSYLNFLYSFIQIDKYGNLLTSVYAVQTSGNWAQQRVADLLPENYVYLGN